ncbi:MAG: hypothetical protein NTY01_09735 [Verrucomicrobia bacterium]|nr:hypothetical protein [Verrucomicrobiota bacterium]
MKPSNRIWGTVSALTLAIIGVAAAFVVITNLQAKIQVRRNRVTNIDSAIRLEMGRAKEISNKPLPNELRPDPLGAARAADVKIVRQFIERQARAFNFCEEEVSALSNQRRQNEEVLYELMEDVNDSTILAVACAIMGLYAVFWLQRYT